MITYTYQCPHHGEFEASHKISEKLTDCPQCKIEGKLESYCPDCNHTWYDDNEYLCKKCYRDESGIIRTTQVVRLISNGSGFILSGGCWAKDNYK